ncbi:Exosome RNA helicase MTR4 [Dermatophagoides pteronyssinus]|uniref:Exosome RNA helicase MTR4 n=2 Tax=Dermatophagoides pteronyssinus TaxID=6956 RepID=A0ABQ8IU54_DERPT|nr:exosome RNA helicase MTR4-like [Dermatophagoides pteronyssinus]KAH9413833.1 Exosome RNA helicase MTR4 [Dermatophagoides pteronyssinus]
MDLFDVFDLDPKSNTNNDNNKRKADDNEQNNGQNSNENGSKNDDNVVDNGLIDKLINDVKRKKGNEDNNQITTSMVEELTRVPNDTDDEDNENLGEINETFTARVEIHELETQGSSCVHEVIIPVDLEYVPLRDHSENPNYKPAKEYKFILDSFQKEAILCIENNQSVLVSAHTSAGKTVVAEYAIASSFQNKQRVIYTTPIKALSNQKYREFQEEFEDVGLITGDVTINPNATCLIMTTEILRLMLFRGSEIMREVGWVIFDEIHYMRDRERGVIWEETIILLPDTVHYVFLSATIPNARQFAEWIAHLHHQSCHVVYTDFRPTPLQHYIYPAGGDGLHLVLDEQNNFREDNFNQAMNVLQNPSGQNSSSSSAKGGDQSCIKVIRTIMERNLAPVILFSFSRKECEIYALQISNLKLDFNSAEEKSLVEEVFNNAIDVLSDDDKKLPQVQQILPLLKRGVGIHHSGLLPLIKETIEILFGEGLIKALFATETFAMGLNMPARTVVFTSVRKFDGTNFRFITSGEYIQMSGRAGRRGIDERGIVILRVDEKVNPAVGKEMICGRPDPLNSAFHLTYNMVLNLLRVEEVNPEYMLEHSFFQFQQYLEYPKLHEKYKKLKEQKSNIKIDNEDCIAEYVKIKNQITDLTKEFLVFITTPRYILPFLNSGRLLKIVNNDNLDMDWGVLINYNKPTMDRKQRQQEPIYQIDVLLPVDKTIDPISETILPPSNMEKCEMKIISLRLSNITQISSARAFLPHDLRSFDSRQSVLKSIQEIKKRFSGNIPLLDPLEDMKIKDNDFLNIVKRIESLEKKLLEFKKINQDMVRQYERKQDIEKKMKQTKELMKKTRSLLQMDELKCRKRVLRRLGYCTSADVIEIKGRVACEITSGDELLLTEMLFNGLFNDLNVYQISALLSCMVFEEKMDVRPKLGEELSKPLKTMQELAKKIATVSKESKLEIDEKIYIEKFRPNLMDVIYSWTKGKSFSEICKMTDAFEGSIIRCMRRLEELLRQMCQASKVIGNTDLENKFSEAIKLIKRDIVFAASLYL